MTAYPRVYTLTLTIALVLPYLRLFIVTPNSLIRTTTTQQQQPRQQPRHGARRGNHTRKSRDCAAPLTYQDELAAFQAAHFGLAATTHFATHFLGPESDALDELGFYDDGHKRCLTDAQVAIFRHSEIQSLLRRSERGGDGGGGDATATGSTRPKRSRGARRAKPDLRTRSWDPRSGGDASALSYDGAAVPGAATAHARRQVSYGDV
jgi:hypothetical protein